MYAKLKHLHDLIGISILEKAGAPLYPKRPTFAIGVPSVIRAYTSTQADFCPMVCAWQQYSFDLLKMWIHESHTEYSDAEVITKAKAVFASMYRDNAWQSNKRGTKTRYDCINGTNDDKDPIGLQPIWTGGNIVKVTGEKVRKFGMDYFPVQCFNGSEPPPLVNDVNWHTHPELIYWGTIETRIKAGRKDRVIRPFSLAGIDKIPAFVIVQNSNTAYIDAHRLHFVSDKDALNNNPYS